MIEVSETIKVTKMDTGFQPIKIEILLINENELESFKDCMEPWDEDLFKTLEVILKETK